VDGQAFADEMQYLSDAGYSKINVRINSPGGSVLDGQSIVSQMRLLNSGDKTQVDTYVDYMAASIAGVIAMYGKKKYIVKNGLFMMHNASGGDGSEKSMEIITLITKTLAEQLAEASGKNVEDVLALMQKETWMDAEDAVNNGFFDGTIGSIVNIKNESNNIHKLYELSNNLLTKKKINMTKVAELLKLSNDASEEIIFEGVQKIQTENNALTQDKAELEQRVIDLEHELELAKNELDSKKDEEIVLFVNKLVNEGKIKEEGKEDALSLARSNFEAYKNFANSIVVGSVGFRHIIDKADNKGTDERAEWTLRDWEKKDPKGLQAMYKNDIEKYNELFNKTYKK
jgi:ATP-dependent protease ClpP protease subunit